ncbi:NAD-P-binding protein [Guyanagaster necrorhizus]|uniref:NAD-P-binding protein n=1 Tax=Guyanagaster necrorhizus TaxID=856835 RepID=A0A9P7VZL8_9AGAR|nr:NAD-P-binding protein [Guyanagaster necrorhizus MCA 3950]KAG7449874.1 NAD-P-binding protein [Guyanagaster necrorhizus MCA 3950]
MTLISIFCLYLVNFYRFLSQSFPPAPKWAADQIPDLSGRVIIVTGGNTGIGKETIRALLKRNAKVYIAARSEKKAQSAIRELLKDTGKEALFLKLDLASLKSVREAASEFKSKELELHILFNNAGVMWPPLHQASADGYDLQFATNVMGHFLLTYLLLGHLKTGAKSLPEKKSRIINTSSGASYLTHRIDWDSLVDGPKRQSWWSSTEALYHQSKFANVVLSNELGRRYGDDGIVSISLNPGNINSELLRHKPLVQHLSRYFLYSTTYGALTQLWAGTAPEAAACNGMFLAPWARIARPNPCTDDPAVAKKLWGWLEEHAL